MSEVRVHLVSAHELRSCNKRFVECIKDVFNLGCRFPRDCYDMEVSAVLYLFCI